MTGLGDTMVLETGARLPDCEVIAHNYGADRPNRIHSDEGAARYGFAGALVPGVAIYGYLCRPVLAAFGRDWLERGTLTAKFLKPVYDRERVTVRASVSAGDPAELRLELHNSRGEIGAVGTARLPAAAPRVSVGDYPRRDSPGPDAIMPASADGIVAGTVLGSVDYTAEQGAEAEAFLANMVEDAPLYFGADAPCHPSSYIARANEILRRNVALGSWIHTGSDTRHCSCARPGERLSLRGRVVETRVQRGHDIAVLDLALFGEADRPVAVIRHSAIVRLAERNAG